MLENQPHSPDSDQLRIMASGQIVSLGWREGMTAQEAAPYAEEALGLARANGNATAEMLLLAGYGRIMAATASADAYVDHLEKALALCTPENASLRILLQVFFCQAYGLAGRLREALAASDAALGGIGQIEKFHEQLLGFNIERWVRSLRARILVRMGDFAAGRESLGELIATEPEHPDPAVQFIPHHGFVELAWLTSDAALAADHAGRLADIARRSDLPYVRVYADACQGLASSLAGDQIGAGVYLKSALEFARQGRAAVEYEPDILAWLAEVHRRSGNIPGTVSAARAAIVVAQDRAARLAETRATVTLAAALSGDAASEAQDLLRRAVSLIEETGADAYKVLLDIPAAAAPSTVKAG
jgi:adenylate cyclase